MAGAVMREEFEARVGVLESEVEGEKLVTRYILEQSRRNGDDLAALKTHFDRLERRVDGMDAKLDALDRKFDGLARNLPQIVGKAVREALRERDGL
jgi:hypothetical protein